jgi:HEPN domain-containing protein
MKPDSGHEALRWFKQSERDLDDAKFLASGNRFNSCCFLAQQAAEKAIKAFLYLQGTEFVWGHSVVELCDDASHFDSRFSLLKKPAASLDKYYIPTRYPDGLPGGLPADAFQKEDSEMAIDKAIKIIECVKTSFDSSKES